MKIHGRKISVFVLIGILLMTGIASAALLTVYATNTTTVNVGQAITLIPETVSLDDVFGGESRIFEMTITNAGTVAIPVKLVSSYTAGGIGQGGITVKYFNANNELIEGPFDVPNGNTAITMEVTADYAIASGTYIITTKVMPS